MPVPNLIKPLDPTTKLLQGQGTEEYLNPNHGAQIRISRFGDLRGSRGLIVSTKKWPEEGREGRGVLGGCGGIGMATGGRPHLDPDLSSNKGKNTYSKIEILNCIAYIVGNNFKNFMRDYKTPRTWFKGLISFTEFSKKSSCPQTLSLPSPVLNRYRRSCSMIVATFCIYLTLHFYK